MFIVVSKWSFLPGREEEWREISKTTRQRINGIPGVEFVHGFVSQSGEAVAVIGYTDEATYNRLVNEPDGDVVKAMADTNVESVGQWLSSDRGESI
ncbi:MAG: hypothetical protein HONBIEJF_01515 [Fimbriimonadaceae bacterium]|nr:hypothetical protein [Fimbriimonadaceae bacterium]